MSACRLFDLCDKAGRKGLDFGIGQSLLHRLQHDGDRERFLAFAQTRALINVKQAYFGDQFAVDGARSAQQALGRNFAVDDKGEIPLDRLEYRNLQRRFCPPRARLRHSVEKDLETGERRPGIEGFQHRRVKLAEGAQHVRAEP